MFFVVYQNRRGQIGVQYLTSVYETRKFSNMAGACLETVHVIKCLKPLYDLQLADTIERVVRFLHKKWEFSDCI